MKEARDNKNIYYSTDGLQQYILIANTDINVCNKIAAEKQVLFNECGITFSNKTLPHIVIAQFLAREAMEETFIRWIQRICTSQQSFTVTLNNYSGFPQHTIYIRVKNYLPFQQLAMQLKPVNEFICTSNCPPMVFNNKPHISMATDLPTTLFAKTMMACSQKIFHEMFEVHELLLLRKEQHAEAYKKVNVFRFQPAGTNLLSEVA